MRVLDPLDPACTRAMAGSSMGPLVGSSMGPLVGSSMGPLVGSSMGPLVGSCMGPLVGSSMHDSLRAGSGRAGLRAGSGGDVTAPHTATTPPTPLIAPQRPTGPPHSETNLPPLPPPPLHPFE